MRLRFGGSGRTVEGAGTITAASGDLFGSLTFMDHELAARALQGPVNILGSYNPGVMLPEDRFAEALPPDENWRAERCIITSRNINPLDPFNSTDGFSCSLLWERGSSNAAPFYERIVYRGAHLAVPTHPTFEANSFRTDSIDGSFQGARLRLRNLP